MNPEQITLEIEKFKIAQNYFSTILSTQTEIFVLIVTVLLVINYIYQRKVSESQIKEIVNSEKKGLEDSLKTYIDEALSGIKKDMENMRKSHEYITSGLEAKYNYVRGEVYRSMALFWDSQKSFPIALLWWVRASDSFNKCAEDILTRNCLSSAANSASKVEYSFEIDANDSSEIQELLVRIDNERYKVEKEVLFDALKAALSKKLETKME